MMKARKKVNKTVKLLCYLLPTLLLVGLIVFFNIYSKPSDNGIVSIEIYGSSMSFPEENIPPNVEKGKTILLYTISGDEWSEFIRNFNAMDYGRQNGLSRTFSSTYILIKYRTKKYKISVNKTELTRFGITKKFYHWYEYSEYVAFIQNYVAIKYA